MELKNEREVEVTREKMRLLESRYDELRQEQASNPHLRELTLRSFKRMINQMKEEIARFEARRTVRTDSK